MRVQLTGAIERRTAARPGCFTSLPWQVNSPFMGSNHPVREHTFRFGSFHRDCGKLRGKVPGYLTECPACNTPVTECTRIKQMPDTAFNSMIIRYLFRYYT